MSDIIHTIRLVTSAAAAIAEVQKYEGAIVGATQTIDKHAETLGGGKVLKNANEWTAAVARLGGATGVVATNEQILAGATKLTNQEKIKLNGTLGEAIGKYTALGQTAPAGMLALHGATKSASESTGLLAGGLGLIGPLIAGMGIKAMVTDFVNSASAIHDMSLKTGIGTDELQRLKYAAEQSGGSLDLVTGAVGKMSNKLVEGDESAVAALKTLNLDFKEMRTQNPGKTFEDIAEAIGRVPDPMLQTKLAMDFFGPMGAQILPMVKEGVKALGDEAERTGQIMGKDVVEAGDQLGDTWDRLLGAGKNLVGGVMAPLVPLLTPLAEGIAWIGVESGKLLSEWLKLQLTDPFYQATEGIKGFQHWWGALRGDLSIPLAPEAVKGFTDITAAAQARVAVSVPVQAAWDAEREITDQANQSLRANKKAAEDAAAATKKFQDSVTNLGTLAYNWTTGLAPAVTSSFNFIALAGIEADEAVGGVIEQFGALPGKALGTENALYGVEGAMKMVRDMTKEIPVVMADVTKPSAWQNLVGSFKGALDQMPGVILGAIQGGGSVGQAAGALVGQTIGSSLSGMMSKTLEGVLGKTIGSMLGSLVPVVGPMISQFLGPMIDKVWGKIKTLFGGPSAKELAGREVADEFRANIIGMMSDAQKLKAQVLVNEGANETWAQSMVTVQDAYIATGRTAEQALADMDALWKAEAQGAGAVEAAMIPIQTAMDEAKKASEDATTEIEDGADDAVPALDDMSVAAGAVGMSVEEVSAAIERMDARLADNVTSWQEWHQTVENAAHAVAAALNQVQPPSPLAGLPAEFASHAVAPPAPTSPAGPTVNNFSSTESTTYQATIGGQEVAMSPQSQQLQASFLTSLERDGAFRTKVKQQLNVGH